MQRLIYGLLMVLVSQVATPVAVANEDGALTVVNVEEVFVPRGFDDNDEVVAVVDGYLPDTCYKIAYNEVHYLAAEHKYVIFQFARKFNALCLQARVPFFAEVQFGILPLGDFQVTSPGALSERLQVAEAVSAGPDDRLYAPIDAARVIDTAEGGQEATLSGRFTNTCMQLDGVNVVNSGKTLEVLPIMYVQDRDDCAETEVPFTWTFGLPASVTEGRRLLHVRSLNGKAVNTLFSAPQ